MPFLKMITAPTEEPITKEEFKDAFARILDASADEDILIDSFIVAARMHGENVITHRAWASRTIELVLDAFPHEILLPYPNVTALTSIKYKDTFNVEQTLSSSLYQTDDVSAGDKGDDVFPPMRIRPAYGVSWPQTYSEMNAVRVRYTCGWTAKANIPDAIKTWMNLRVASMYENREAVVIGQTVELIPRDYVDGLLDPYVVFE